MRKMRKKKMVVMIAVIGTTIQMMACGNVNSGNKEEVSVAVTTEAAKSVNEETTEAAKIKDETIESQVDITEEINEETENTKEDAGEGVETIESQFWEEASNDGANVEESGETFNAAATAQRGYTANQVLSYVDNTFRSQGYSEFVNIYSAGQLQNLLDQNATPSYRLRDYGIYGSTGTNIRKGTLESKTQMMLEKMQAQGYNTYYPVVTGESENDLYVTIYYGVTEYNWKYTAEEVRVQITEAAKATGLKNYPEVFPEAVEKYGPSGGMGWGELVYEFEDVNAIALDMKESYDWNGFEYFYVEHTRTNPNGLYVYRVYFG